MTKLTERIDDVYVLYLLNNKDIKKTELYKNKITDTLKKYIRIKEELL